LLYFTQKIGLLQVIDESMRKTPAAKTE